MSKPQIELTINLTAKILVDDPAAWAADYGLDVEDAHGQPSVAAVAEDVREYFATGGLDQVLRDLNQNGALSFKVKDARSEVGKPVIIEG